MIFYDDHVVATNFVMSRLRRKVSYHDPEFPDNVLALMRTA